MVGCSIDQSINGVMSDNNKNNHVNINAIVVAVKEDNEILAATTTTTTSPRVL
jgi:hypothetical protein